MAPDERRAASGSQERLNRPHDLRFDARDVGQERARLEVLQVAQPCRPFSGWALGDVVEARVLKETLQFLEGGTRGYYCVGVGTGIVALGDRVAVV